MSEEKIKELMVDLEHLAKVGERVEELARRTITIDQELEKRHVRKESNSRTMLDTMLTVIEWVVFGTGQFAKRANETLRMYQNDLDTWQDVDLCPYCRHPEGQCGNHALDVIKREGNPIVKDALFEEFKRTWGKNAPKAAIEAAEKFIKHEVGAIQTLNALADSTAGDPRQAALGALDELRQTLEAQGLDVNIQTITVPQRKEADLLETMKPHDYKGKGH